MKAYFNHSLIENIPISQLNNLFREIQELRIFCIKKNLGLYFYEKLWNTNVEGYNLLNYLYQSKDRNNVMLLIQSIKNGPFFPANLFKDIEVIISPKIIPNTFGEKILKICFNECQKEIVSFQNEKNLLETNYKVTDICSSHSKEILNFRGIKKLQEYLNALLQFKTIEEVFELIKKETDNIIFLDRAIKSIKKHDFRTFLSEVYYGITGLEKTELQMLLANDNETDRQKIFRQNYGLEISGESSETLRRHSDIRTFAIPNIGEKLFEWHIKIDGNRTRIHYWIDKKNKKVYIGHCGKHLETAGN